MGDFFRIVRGRWCGRGEAVVEGGVGGRLGFSRGGSRVGRGRSRGGGRGRSGRGVGIGGGVRCYGLR